MSEKSHIDAVLSLHFDECSIAAADAAREATAQFRIMSHSVEMRAVQPIGRYTFDGTEEWDVTSLVNAEVDHSAFSEQKVELAIAKHTRFSDMPLSLVALFNSDAMMPIASFEPRTDGQCSYVQIGQEIEEDKLVVTENAPRNVQVEAIREVLKHKKVTSELCLLICEEATQYRSEIERTLMPSVTRRAEQYFSSQERTAHTLHVINEDDPSEPAEKIRVEGAQITVITDSLLDNKLSGHNVTLFLGRQVHVVPNMITEKKRFGRANTREVVTSELDEALELFASIRGGIAVRLAHFDTESGNVTLPDYDCPADLETLNNLLPVFQVSDDMRQQTAKLKSNATLGLHDGSLLLLLNKNQDNSVSFSYSNQYTDGRPVNYNDRWTTGWVDLASIDSWSQAKDGILHKLQQDSYAYRRAIPDIKNPVDANIIRLVDTLEIENRLSRLIDNGETAHETIIKQVLGAIGTKPVVSFEGVLKNHTAGKTKTDVQTKVQLSNDGNQVRVVVEGRPLALEGFDHATMFDESLRLDAKNSVSLEQSRAEEMAQVIGAICNTL